MIKPMVLADLYISIGMCMKDIGLMILQMDSAFIIILMDLGKRGSGLKIVCREWLKKNGQINLIIKENILMA